jgi:hypothetical protein
MMDLFLALGVAVMLVPSGLVVALFMAASRGTPPVQPARGTATATATRGAAQVTPVASATVAVSLPTAVIRFSGAGRTTAAQQCDGAHPLDPVVIALDNTGSTISVDWWLDVHETAPDGKTAWASGEPPYGTVPAGQSSTLNIMPDPNLCTLLQGQTAPVTYHATVNFGGIGGFMVTDTITPPSAGSIGSASPFATPTVHNHP